MASNFFQRWSSRSLTAKDTAANALADTHTVASLDAEHAIEPICEENSELAQTDSLSNKVDDDALVGNANQETNEDKSHHDALTIDDADSVTFDSGVASFLQQGVDKSVKKAALAKLFHSDEFNYISDMDDHTEDFSNIPKLDESVVKQLRGWVNKVVEESEDAELEFAEATNAELISAQEISAVNDKTAEPVMEDLDLSPRVDESNNKKDPQGET